MDSNLMNRLVFHLSDDSISSLIGSFFGELYPNLSNNEDYYRLYIKFMHLAIKTAAQRLRFLKIRLLQEINEGESASFEKLDAFDKCAPMEPKVISALEHFNDALPSYLKNIMIKSGFNVLETEEIHCCYLSAFSTFITSQTKKLFELKSSFESSKVNQTCHDQPTTRLSVSTTSSQSAHEKIVEDHLYLKPYDTAEFIKKTKKHLIYHDPIKNIAIKLLRSEHPEVRNIENLENEFNLPEKVLHPALRNSMEKRIYQSRKALTLEWAQGYPLSEINNANNFNVKDFLVVAREVVSALLAMHSQQIMHMNLTCDHIIVNPESNSVKIIGCGSSSSFNTTTHYISNRDLSDKDLRCISPEQTFLVNKEVDFRSDFYSLGIIFYKMLTNRYPFENKDDLKLIYSHILEEPIPTSNLNCMIPFPVSMMISLLMKKNADERYQSCKGLIYDLDLMISEYQSDNNLASVTLKQNDIPQSLIIPQQLYGRCSELESLLSVMSNESHSFEIVFVKGKSGCGKSFLVFELYKPVIEKNGFFVCGKYDRKMSKPYAGLIEAMNNLCSDIIFKEECVISQFKSHILEAIGDEGKILTDVIGNLNLIIGQQSSSSKTLGQEAKNQFNYVFIKFIKAVCSVGFPIVFVLEDLHWIDLQSLNLLSALIKDKSVTNFVLISTYRDNEVNEDHPVSTLLKEVDKMGIRTRNITLKNLNHETLNEMISNTFYLSPLETYPLTISVYQKTKGNAFFAVSLLKSWYDQGHLFFCNDSSKWKWDASILDQSNVNENVLELLRLKILQYDEHTQLALKTASCLGNPFSLLNLELIVNSKKGIMGALNTGMITQYKGNDNIYHFVHDNIQEAAFSLLPTDSKQIFFYIGKKLWQLSTNKDHDEIVFVVANLLYNTIDIVLSNEDRAEMVMIFLKAGEKAMSTTAFHEAFTYLDAAVNLLEKECWQNQYEYTLQVYNVASEAAFSATKYAKMSKLIDTISDNVSSNLDLVDSYCLNIKYYNDKGMLQDAINTARIILDKIDKDIFCETLTEEEFLETKSLIIGKSNQEIAAMGSMQKDALPSKTIKILYNIMASCHFANPKLFVVVACRIVQLTIKYGVSKYSALGFVALGTILCR